MGHLPAPHPALDRQDRRAPGQRVWLFAYWGRLPVENISAISWFGLFSVTAILAVSMSWSRVRGGGGHTPS
jgi:hypothetical protein